MDLVPSCTLVYLLTYSVTCPLTHLKSPGRSTGPGVPSGVSISVYVTSGAHLRFHLSSVDSCGLGRGSSPGVTPSLLPFLPLDLSEDFLPHSVTRSRKFPDRQSSTTVKPLTFVFATPEVTQGSVSASGRPRPRRRSPPSVSH